MLRTLPVPGFLGLLGVVYLPLACGGSDAAPKTADDTPAVTAEDRPAIATSAEIGGMNEDAVDAAFNSSVKSLQRCLDKGATRVEFLAGSVNFFLKINSQGKVDRAYLEHSTIGDRATERCMLDALRAKSWPKPVGGEHGLARKSFAFDPPNDVRPPTEWDQSDAAPGLKKIAPDLQACKEGRSGTFEATLYVDTEGKVLAASVTPPDEDGDTAVDCMVEILESASFPSPGSWPAKVTLHL
jgi:hypothetical protein